MRTADKLAHAVLAALARGWRVVSGVWGVVRDGDRWSARSETVCPLGAMLVETDAPSDVGAREAAARELGVSVAWIDGFIDGIDGATVLPVEVAPEYVTGLEVGSVYRRTLDRLEEEEYVN